MDLLSRRRLLHGGLAGLGLLAAGSPFYLTPGAFAQELTRTPHQMEGPFYPTKLPLDTDNDLLIINNALTPAVGQVTHFSGRILDAKGRPLPEATVEVWQADSQGRYKHPKWPGQDSLDPNFGYFGKVKTAQDGTYLFKTILPSRYQIVGITRAPHIHLRMRHPEHGCLTTQVYFEGKQDDELREKDPVWQGHSRVTRDRLILAKQSPRKFADLNIAFEESAVCCKNDLAFLLG